MKFKQQSFRYTLAAVYLCFLLLTSLQVSALGSSTTVCSEGCRFSNLQEAVDKVKPGSTIKIQKGIFHTNLRIDKSVTIQGSGAPETTLKGEEAGEPVIKVGPSEIQVSLIGLTVGPSTGEKCKDERKGICPAGIVTNGDSQLNIRDTELIGNKSGLLARHRTTTNASNISITGNELSGLVVTHNATLKLKKSRINNNGELGLRLEKASQTDLIENQIIQNAGFDLAIFEGECFETSSVFRGRIKGYGNSFSKNNGAVRNKVCPSSLDFLAEGTEKVYSSPLILAKGNPEANVTVMEYSDFLCPYCSKFADNVLPKIEKDYINTGKVYFVFRNFPIHGTTAERAARATLCANSEGRFWEFHDRLFRGLADKGSSFFTPENIASQASQMGLDGAEFRSCFSSDKYAPVIEASVQEGNRRGVFSTPTFFVNGKKIIGAQPYPIFKELIESELE